MSPDPADPPNREAPLNVRPLRSAILPPVLLAALQAGLLVTGCAGGRAAPDAAGPGDGWDALLAPRPAPLADAPRVTIARVHLLPSSPWEMADPLPAGVGTLELIAAELLRRQDVHFVERRRFAEAAERERRGEPRSRRAPPVGTSPGSELFATLSWAPSGEAPGALDLRLTDAATGEVVTTRRLPTPIDAGPVEISRRGVLALLEALESADRRPRWEDAPPVDTAASVPTAAVDAFFRGVRAEDAYDWETARDAYEEAARIGGAGFHEPRVALARVARLRAGGSLAES